MWWGIHQKPMQKVMLLTVWRNLIAFINGRLLIDPPLTNSKFTWSNLRVQPTLFKLDRFLYSTGWENLFIMHYSRTTSDHFPVVLETKNLSWGPAPFRFSNYFLKKISFKKNLEFWWLNTHQSGHPGYSLMRRLRQLSTFIKEWSKKKKVEWKW